MLGESQTPFLWGIATAAHHIEGNNINSDWWHEEEKVTGGVSSGEACDSYRQFKRDRTLVTKLGCNSYRFSIEWSRIEPEPGRYNLKEAEHYIEVIDDLLINGITPIVTLHHFTNPLWFEAEGGWLQPNSPEIFSKYLKFIIPLLGDRVRYFTPINEPNVFTSNKYVGGVWHPYTRDLRIAWSVLKQLALAHKDAYSIIKGVIPQALVGTCVQTLDLRGLRSLWWPVNAVLASLGAYLYNRLFYSLIGGQMDFVGLNFYSSFRLGLNGVLPKPAIAPNPAENGHLTMISEPDRLLSALWAVSRYNKQIMITENGKLTDNDEERKTYLTGVFEVIKRALADGIPLIGYQHFTHMDSFEWNFAFGPQFGLASHNPKTHEIKIKESGYHYSQLINEFTHWQANTTRSRT